MFNLNDPVYFERYGQGQVTATRPSSSRYVKDYWVTIKFSSGPVVEVPASGLRRLQ